MRPELITSEQWRKYNSYFIQEHFMGKKWSEKHLRKKRKALYDEAMKNPGMEERGEIIDVKKIEFDSFKDFENDVEGLLSKPLLFRGAALDWPCCQKWSKDFFRERYSKTPISLIDNPGLVDPKTQNKFKKTDLGTYLKEVEEDSTKYLRFSRILDNNPELLNDLDLDWLRESKHGWTMGEQTFMFMGEAGTVTPTHAGMTHTTFIQITGRKKWTLWAPNERFFLDPVADRVLYYYTTADPYDMDLERYPLLPYSKRYELILEAGDVLWFPSLFWHHITNLTGNIGVAFKYSNFPQSFHISKVLAALIFMATKPTVVKSFLYNRKNVQDLLFDRENYQYQ